jgi:hypothetical protein
MKKIIDSLFDVYKNAASGDFREQIFKFDCVIDVVCGITDTADMLIDMKKEPLKRKIYFYRNVKLPEIAFALRDMAVDISGNDWNNAVEVLCRDLNMNSGWFYKRASAEIWIIVGIAVIENKK